jgi:hypothetical protein
MGLKHPKIGIFDKKSINLALRTKKVGFFDPIPRNMSI